MKLFTIIPDSQNWGKDYHNDIVARRNNYLPGIKCDLCGQTWARLGIAYPLVDISVLTLDKRLFRPRAVPVDEYKQLRDLVAPLIAENLPLPPGTGFGPLVGREKGVCGDFSWANSWTLLIKQSSYLNLQSLSLKLPKVSIPNLKTKKIWDCELYELEIEARVSLIDSSYYETDSKICLKCGRDERKVEKIIVNKNSIPPELDMFRIADFPTHILVTERFKYIVTQLGFSNILFMEIEMDG
jgi:uncharacterized double-CXXCG motif protein